MRKLNSLQWTAKVYSSSQLTSRKFQKSVPVLRIDWHLNTDYFSFHIEDGPFELPFTKRSVLSRIARLFDTMRWLTPILINTKIIIQSLWILKVDWDEELPLDISNRWQTWLQDLHSISHIKIPRWSGFTPHCELIEVHGFVDASKFARGAVIYLRKTQNQDVLDTLQVAETHVASLKTLNIHPLELHAALLLTRLTHTSSNHFRLRLKVFIYSLIPPMCFSG